MAFSDIPVNITGCLIAFAWFLSGLYAMKLCVRENVKNKVPSSKRNMWGFLSLPLGPTGIIVYFVYRNLDILKGAFQHSSKKEAELDHLPLSILDEHGRDMLSKRTSDKSAMAVKKIIWDALELSTSDIFIDPKNESYVVRMRVDGSIRIHSTLPEEEALPVISMFKVFSNMDIAERRRPQDGSFSAVYKDTPTSFRVATVGVHGGEKITIRVIASENSSRTLEEVGFSKTQYETVSSALKLPSGMILMCGPTGSGKTSTLYSMLGSIDYDLKNVMSIEDPVERVIPNISQIEVNSKAGITFASVLRNSLRQNPDVICLGEIRDEETAQVAAQAAQTGHLIIATLHSNDNVGTIVRLTDLGVPLRNIAAALHLSVSQRLVRRLCPHCKKNADLTPEQQQYCKQYNIPFDAIKAPVGCPKCGGTGYQGRVAIFELMVVDDGLRAVLEAPDATTTDVKNYVDAHLGNNSFGSRIMTLVIQGETSWEEYERIMINL